MSRFFVPAENVGDEYIVIDEKEDIKHIAKVLRLKKGDEIDISDSLEWEYITKIMSINDKEIQLKILDKQRFAREPSLEITLFQGIPKQGKMETVIQKSVELGVKKIVPVFMKRTVVVDKGKMEKKTERWQKISNEAVKQCKRGIIPKVENALKMEEALQELKNYDVVIFPYENEEKRTIKDCLRQIASDKIKNRKEYGKIAVIIGPEGGFSDREAEEIEKLGAYCVSLGKTVLRTETAGIAAIAMIMYELEM